MFTMWNDGGHILSPIRSLQSLIVLLLRTSSSYFSSYSSYFSSWDQNKSLSLSGRRHNWVAKTDGLKGIAKWALKAYSPDILISGSPDL